MRSQFKNTFQPALGGNYQVRLAYPVSRPQLFSGFRRHDFTGHSPTSLGTTVYEDERTAVLNKIKNGEARMAQVRKWIASRIDQDPMLLRTFGQEYISKNFWGYDDIVVKDQYYVDQALGILQGNPESAQTSEMEHLGSSWEVEEETLARVDEWATAIDNMYQGMQEFGKTPLTTTTGQTIPNTTAPGTTVPSASGKKATGPTTQPSGGTTGTQDKILGIPKTTFWIGVGSLGIVALALFAKKAM